MGELTDRLASNEYNETLSENRANAIKAYLMENFDIDESQFISIEGEGEAQANQEETEKQDRRVNIRVVKIQSR